MTRPFLCFGLIFLTLLPHEEAAPLTLTIKPGGKFDVFYRLITGQAVAAVLNISGNLAADLEWSAGGISRFRFNGANVAYSDTTSDMVITTFPSTKVRLLTRSVVSSVASDAGAGALNSGTGVLANSGHFLRQDRGTVTTRYMVGHRGPGANPKLGHAAGPESIGGNHHSDANPAGG